MRDKTDSGEFSGTTRQRGALLWCAVLFTMVLPTVTTWGYFVLAERYSTSTQQAIYLTGKIVQFTFPILWTLLVLRERPQFFRRATRGLTLGIVFGVVVVAAGWVLFEFVLRDAPIFDQAASLIDVKIRGFGIDSALKYALLATFYSVLHSLLEEYYWRWFVFKRLNQLVALWLAIVLSSAAFAAHHVVVLNEFFDDAIWLVVLLSAAVALGGAFWAWLYERSQSLLPVWISHLVIDAGIFWIGYDLVRTTWST